MNRYALVAGARLCAWRIWGSAALLVGAAAGALAADGLALVDPALPAYQPLPVQVPAGARYVRADGAIRILGAEHTQTMIDALDRLFVQTHPGFRFAPDLKGTSPAVPPLAHGVSAFAPMGRDINGVELVQYGKVTHGGKPLEIRVAHDSIDSRTMATTLAVYVNRKNPLAQLSMEQVKRIFATGSVRGDITRWGQLGLPGAWGIEPIHTYGTPAHTGFGDHMERFHFDGLPFATGYEEFGDSTAILEHVGKDPNGIGYAAIGRLTPEVKLIALAAGDGSDGRYFSGTAAETVAHQYPLTRHLLFYVNRPKGQPTDPFVKEYFRMVFSREGQRIVASEDNGYLPLSASEAAAELRKLDGGH